MVLRIFSPTKFKMQIGCIICVEAQRSLFPPKDYKIVGLNPLQGARNFQAEANHPTIVSYNAIGNRVHFENKNIFFYIL
jgi:hypothetical protein